MDKPFGNTIEKRAKKYANEECRCYKCDGVDNFTHNDCKLSLEEGCQEHRWKEMGYKQGAKDQRDWSKFKRPRKRFNPKDFKPFDKVLIKHHYESERWVCNFFSDMLPNGEAHCLCLDVHECIPYNDETKHLVGTTDDCPEFYKWWEE